MDSSASQAALLCASSLVLGVALVSLAMSRRESKDERLLELLYDKISGEGSSSRKSHSSGKSTHEVRVGDLNEDTLVSLRGGDGFSMADARKRSEQLRSTFKDLTPSEVLLQLQKGNARFWTGNAVRPEKSAFERRALIMQQFPVTAVLGCSDSRVPVEVVFDQGLGDMFVVRVAGNCLSTATTASLQYAVHHLKVKVLMVMGHEACGAIKAAGLPSEQIEKEPKELATALKMLKTGLDGKRLANIHDGRAHDREAVITNIKRQVDDLMKDAGIKEKVDKEELIVVGCFYEISSGIVDFLL
jgi:carbonic anhydrase